MKKGEQRQNNKGFSLVELIIVIAIIAILVGAIAPKVFAYVEASRITKDRQIVDTVFTAVQTAIADYSGDPVSLTNVDLDDASLAYTEIPVLLQDDLDTDARIANKVRSSSAKGGHIVISYDSTTRLLDVYFVNSSDTKITTLEVTN